MKKNWVIELECTEAISLFHARYFDQRPYLTPKLKVMGTQIWHAGRCSLLTNIFREIRFELMTSSL